METAWFGGGATPESEDMETGESGSQIWSLTADIFVTFELNSVRG